MKVFVIDYLTHYQKTNFRLFQTERFDKNGKKLSKQVENTVGKGEIACCFSHSVFKRLVSQGASKGVIVWEWINPLPDDKILDRSKLKQIADDIVKVHLKWKISTIQGRKHCEKWRNCLFKQFLLFSQCFPLFYIFSASKCSIVW